MKHRTLGALLVTLAVNFLVAPLAAEAQPSTNVHRIGWLSAGQLPSGPASGLGPFRQGLRDLGYIEGQIILIEDRSAEGRDDRISDLASELVRLNVDVIVAAGSAAIRAAQHTTTTIPIVMACSGDPFGQGFIASLAQPGGNITGLSCQDMELIGKRLQLLKELVSYTPRIAVLGNPAISTYVAQVREVQAAAHALGVELHILEVRSPTEFKSAFATMLREGAGALVVLPDGGLLLDRHHSDIAAFALQSRLPAMSPWRWYVDAGGLMSYAPRMPDLQRRAATYVDKLLKGAKPADLPVEQPTKFELVINLSTAQALGLTIPPSLLFQADEVLR